MSKTEIFNIKNPEKYNEMLQEEVMNFKFKLYHVKKVIYKYFKEVLEEDTIDSLARVRVLFKDFKIEKLYLISGYLTTQESKSFKNELYKVEDEEIYEYILLCGYSRDWMRREAEETFVRIYKKLHLAECAI